MEHVEDGETHVQSDEIGQGQRPHRVRHPELHHGVDGLGRRHPLHHAEDGLVDHRHQDAIGDESGIVVHLDRDLAQRPRRLHDRGRGGVAGGVSPNHLDQLHHRDGVHEVHPDHLLGPPGARRDLGDGDRAGVGREDRAGRGDAIELLEDRELHRRVLARRLYNEVGAGGGIQRGPRLHPGEDLPRSFRRDGALLHLAVEIAADRCGGLVQRARGAVHQRYLPAVLGEDVGDAVPHGAGADDGGSGHDRSFPAQRRATRTAMVSARVEASPPSGPKAPPVSQAGDPGS